MPERETRHPADLGWTLADGSYLCDGCAVNEPHEHRCHRDDGAWKGAPACGCAECAEFFAGIAATGTPDADVPTTGGRRTRGEETERAVVGTFPNTGARVFTADAVAGMVGQRPMFTLGGDVSRPLGRAVVEDAALRDGEVHLSLRLPAAAADVVGGFVRAGRMAVGVGYTVERSDGDDVTAAKLHEAYPAPAVEAAPPGAADVPVHLCPPRGSGTMPCCGRTPFERAAERMTLDPDAVTCTGR